MAYPMAANPSVMAATTGDPDETEVRLTYAEGFGYSAGHLPTGLASQGDTEEEALVALAEALVLHRRSDEDAVQPDPDWFDRHGLEPGDTESGDKPLPDFLG